MAGGGNRMCVNPSSWSAQESGLQGEFSLFSLEKKKEEEVEEKKEERLNESDTQREAERK